MRSRLGHRGVSLVLLLLMSVAAFRVRPQPSTRPTRILLLYERAPEQPPIASVSRDLRATLRARLPAVEFFEENLDFDRFPNRERWPDLAHYFANKYSGFAPDVIVAVGASALQFTSAHLRPFLADVPVVFALTYRNAVSVATLPPNVTGRLFTVPLATTIAMAHRLQAKLDRVIVVGGTSPLDSVAVAATVAEFAQRRDRARLELWQGMSLDSLKRALRHLTPRAMVFIAHFRRDGAGRFFATDEFVDAISRESPVPVYGYVRQWMGHGIVGGSVLVQDDEGERTADLVLRSLRRRPGERTPPAEDAPSTLVVDARQMAHWNLSDQRLPTETQILFRMPSSWERYRLQILSALGVISAQSLLIGLLLLERRRRKNAQRAIEEQVAYEQTIAELTTDAVRHAPDESPRALEDALARTARYAGADAAVLVQFPDIPLRPPTRLFWTASAETPNGHGSSAAMSQPTNGIAAVNGKRRLEIPLVADGASIGSLELYRRSDAGDWPTRLVGRLDAAGELIAGAMARARAARTIRRGEELNRAVLASLSTQIAILDRNGTIIRVNEAWRSLARSSGVDPAWDAFLGANYLEECHRAEQRGCEYAREVRRGIEAVLEREAWPFRYEYHVTAPDERWYELFVERLEHVDGRAIIAHLDITNRRLAERRAEETRRQVAHMGRVALIGELAATMSHELRQPLSAIRANAEAGAILLAKAPDDVSTLRQIFLDIVDDDARAAEVIDQVRSLLRKDEPMMSLLDVNSICQHAARLLHGDARLRHTRLDLSLEPALPPVFGDAIQLQQVVLNLTINALDAVSTSAAENHAVTVSTEARDGSVEISIRDTGGGIAPEVQQHLFESFFSTKTRGLGLGLVIVRSIVERHSGRVLAENHPLGGAVFRVMLPAREAAGVRAPLSLLDCRGEVGTSLDHGVRVV